MDHATHLVATAAHEIYGRANATHADPATQSRPPVFKAIGISLAVGSGAFIGTSFVLKKVGLLKANEKYNEVAGEGYGYLKNAFWWTGMTLMILGELLNFVAYAFTDAILVTPLGALSVVITTVLSAFFLKERLSMVGKVACFLCIVGSVVIVMNAPQESSVATIQEMRHYVIAPGFLSYAGVILLGSVAVAFFVGPKYGKKNMLVYLSICSWVGGLSVVATQGLGAAIVAQIGGTPQFNQWFLYVLLVFVICTLVTEIIFLNKALNLFNAAMVTPTYYVYFTSTTIITSAVLFRGFKGTATSIVTVVMGFLTICSGVVLLQLSKSAKDVPDAAVFAGDLDQIHTIAEQEQPETEPKADAIRGAAAIVRRFSVARQKMEIEELRRLHQEKERERLQPLSEDGSQYEWDGLRRRRTVLGSTRSRATSSPNPFGPPPRTATTTPHPPLGMSYFPTEEELAEHDRPSTAGALSSIVGTIRNRTRSVLLPGHPDYRPDHQELGTKAQSPMHPVQLTEIAVPAHSADESPGYYGNGGRGYGLPTAGKTEYEGSGANIPASGRRVQFRGETRQASQGSVSTAASGGGGLAPPTPPPHSARRQFSFQNVFRRHQQHDEPPQQHQHQHDGAQDPHEHRPVSRPGILRGRGHSNPQVEGATEEEQLGLVKGDSRSLPALPTYEEAYDEDDDADDAEPYVDDKQLRYGRGITAAAAASPPRRRADGDEKEAARVAAREYGGNDWGRDPQRWRSGSESSQNSSSSQPRRPPPAPGGRRRPGGDGAFI